MCSVLHSLINNNSSFGYKLKLSSLKLCIVNPSKANYYTQSVQIEHIQGWVNTLEFYRIISLSFKKFMTISL